MLFIQTSALFQIKYMNYTIRYNKINGLICMCQHEEVQRFFHEVKTNGESILRNRFRKVLSSGDGVTKYADRPLEKVEINKISQILQTDIDYRLNVPKNFP